VEPAFEHEVRAVLRLEILLHVLEVVLPGRPAALGRHETEGAVAEALGLLDLIAPVSTMRVSTMARRRLAASGCSKGE